ncbi:aldehyde ferredoxin oxidoreductase [Caldalkalibacillus thermarum TA2.A1]|uniref:Aldehyde ferredoxin oxidoreductase n=2 Tax=Caldalkalibacillus thermarum (strain TA2.A1) TaxID=986075 RepID=F5L739_CALTT|nr:aldehyde ferredoxin oxidoreductase family protein [Caldalkalibacillus thermarum]EGL82815.1 aldehyde ferredoxin oxidoreductase [Caldalkalibacillus thermarum TA2.A1]
MSLGINGKILRVNLTQGTHAIDRPDEAWYRMYHGGRGLIAYYLYKELKPGIDPLGPDNKLIFAAGPLTGEPFGGAGRNSVGAKSPLTGAYGDGEAGGFWGSFLKRAGYDAVIVEGQAEKPVYIAIEDGQVAIHDASDIWGKDTAYVDEYLKAKHGRGAKVCQCGIAGENLVRYATVVNDINRMVGRTGMGAVMGSKKLKAIVVKGKQMPKMSNPQRVKELAAWMGKNHAELTKGFHKMGTSGIVQPLNRISGLPTRNFRDPFFEYAEQISGEAMHSQFNVKDDTCNACPIRCKRVVESEEHQVDGRFGGAEYEHLSAIGSNLGISDLAALMKATERCNAYGVDVISLGVTIACAMEAYEKGIITKEDTDGIELTWGNAETLLTLIEKICRREGIGDLLAEGSMRFAEKIGGGAEEFALHIKGLELPMHEPRLKQGMGVGYAISPTGADHCHNLHDTGTAKNVDFFKPLGAFKPVPADDIGPEKIRMLVYFTNWRHYMNSAVVCQFLPWTIDHLVELTNGVTGWDTNVWELMKVGERAATLTRLFNLREGFTAEDDRLPKRFFKPFKEGYIKGKAPSEEDFRQAIRYYYQMMGWDEQGVPTDGKLAELGILWARDDSAREVTSVEQS